MLRASSRDEGMPHTMLYAGLDLSRKRLDFCLLDQLGERVEVGAAPPDADGLRGLAGRVARFAEPVRAAIESMKWRTLCPRSARASRLAGGDRRRGEGEGSGAAGL